MKIPVKAVFGKDLGGDHVTGSAMHIYHSRRLHGDIMAVVFDQHLFQDPFGHEAADNVCRAKKQNRQKLHSFTTK